MNNKFLGISIIFLSVSISFLVTQKANAGTIIRAPAYLGLNAGLVGYWTFDGPDIGQSDSLFIAKDRSAYNNSASASATIAPTRVTGKMGQGLDFTTPGDQKLASLNSNIGHLTEFTISAWVKPRSIGDCDTSLNVCGAFVDRGSVVTASRITFGFNDVAQSGGNANSFRVNTDGDPSDFTFTTGVNTVDFGVWQNVVLTVSESGQISKIFKNGVEAGSQSGGAITLGGNNAAFHIGGLYDAQDSFDGSIDDVRIYNRALSAGEISRLHTIGLGSKVNRASGGDALDKGLVGHWTFDGSDISGTRAKDRSGNNNHGTVTGAISTSGKIGQALTFDGVDDVVSVAGGGGLNALQSGTITFWTRWNGTQDPGYSNSVYGAVTGRQYDSNWSNHIIGLDSADPDSGHVITNLYQWDTPVVTGATVVGNNIWRHVAVTYQSGNQVLYIDGKQDDTGNTVGTINDFSSIPLTIGAWIDSGDSYLFGNIDDIRVYNRILSATEIKKLYDQTQSKFNSSQTDALTKGLVGHWTFDGPDISGTRVKDRSGNNFHGTFYYGSPTVTPGRLGQALSFNGSSDYIEVGTDGANVAGNFTVMAWVYKKGSAIMCVICKSDDIGNSQNYYLRPGGNSGFTTAPSSWVEIATPNPSLNEWAHVALTYNGSKLRYYINGSQNNEIDGSGTPETGMLLAIGEFGEYGTNYWNGYIDDARVYNRALSAGEVQKLYNMGR